MILIRDTIIIVEDTKNNDHRTMIIPILIIIEKETTITGASAPPPPRLPLAARPERAVHSLPAGRPGRVCVCGGGGSVAMDGRRAGTPRACGAHGALMRQKMRNKGCNSLTALYCALLHLIAPVVECCVPAGRIAGRRRDSDGGGNGAHAQPPVHSEISTSGPPRTAERNPLVLFTATDDTRFSMCEAVILFAEMSCYFTSCYL